jgi:hypothetical protein
MTRQAIMEHLQRAFREHNLTLYLGAGVSVSSGVPMWEELVATMYFWAVHTEQREERLRPSRAYLRAIAEWHLRRRPEPLEVTAQKIRHHYRHAPRFLESLRRNLYPGFLSEETWRPNPDEVSRLRDRNKTLDAVTSLVETRVNGGVRAVVTYNFDSLLETALGNRFLSQPIWRADQKRKSGSLPIFHVHGYVPLDDGDDGSTANELTFAED